MSDLILLLGGIGGVLAGLVTYIARVRSKSHKQGAKATTDALQEADNAEANSIRRRADAARELHADKDSGLGFRD